MSTSTRARFMSAPQIQDMHQRSRAEPRDRPRRERLRPFEEPAVVKPVLAPLPELHPLWHQAVAAPERRPRNDRTSESLLDLDDPSPELFRGDLPALRGSPGGDLASARACHEIDVGG